MSARRSPRPPIYPAALGSDSPVTPLGPCAAIRAAVPVADPDRIPSASFEYLITSDTTLSLGLDALKQAIPYLYATRSSLGRVELEINSDSTEFWTAGETFREPFENGHVEYRALHVERNGIMLSEMRIFRFVIDGGTSAALVLVEKEQDRWKARFLNPNTPRVYRESLLSISNNAGSVKHFLCKLLRALLRARNLFLVGSLPPSTKARV